MMPYEKYDAWKASHALALEIYRSTEEWPNRELYGLTADPEGSTFGAHEYC